ncbi:hypothetical protein FN846DRAFT_164073 [Sphaerosporella brunnea]|uniref:Uncharacterized protein n=1 Tax=Sphaerosporella brunnea TaxID=1250544 RepID=A0A5J5F8F4_9PEZI|nr:hypothetical protein FN846DRAFT_164073 [Sphaerosporella brunnea]
MGHAIVCTALAALLALRSCEVAVTHFTLGACICQSYSPRTANEIAGPSVVGPPVLEAVSYSVSIVPAALTASTCCNVGDVVDARIPDLRRSTFETRFDKQQCVSKLCIRQPQGCAFSSSGMEARRICAAEQRDLPIIHAQRKLGKETFKTHFVSAGARHTVTINCKSGAGTGGVVALGRRQPHDVLAFCTLLNCVHGRLSRAAKATSPTSCCSATPPT